MSSFHRQFVKNTRITKRSYGQPWEKQRSKRTRAYHRARSQMSVPATLVSHRGEVKTLDLPQQTSLISTTGVFQAVNIVQEGSSFYQRIGRKIMMRSIRITGQLAPTANGAGVSEYIRLMLIYDRQPNGANPSNADLLTSYDNQGNTTTTSFSHLNMNNAERFRVLRDVRIVIPINNTGAAGNSAEYPILDYSSKCNIDWYIKLRDLETHYKASSNPAVIGDQATGALLLFAFGNVAAGTAGFNFLWSSRLRYVDV